MRPSAGLIENCTLLPPVSTPISRRIAIEASRISWYSLSVSVCDGATVIESPVWMPIGSRFSIEHTMMQLSALSRTTSISYSFQPISDSSISSSRVGDRSSPRWQIVDELFHVVGDAAARAAEREARPDHRREADLLLHSQRLGERVRDARARGGEPDARHRLLELQAVLGLLDRLGRGADQFDVVLVQDPVLVEVHRAVERGLPAHRRQDRVRLLLRDDAFDHLPGDRLDVRDVGHLRVGHDRRRIAVDEDDPVALLPQRLAGLRAGVVELARLADDDRAGADDQNALEVSATRHRWPCSCRERAGAPPARSGCG